MANLAPIWRPKRPPNRGRNPKNSTSKKVCFSKSILKGFGLRFGRFFRWFFEGCAELILNCDSKLRTLKIVISLRENTYFQKNLESEYAQFLLKNTENSQFFGTFDFGGILGGFGEGFGRRKSSIFAKFSMFFRSKF